MKSGYQDIEQSNAVSLSDNVCFALYTASNALIRAYRPLLEQYDLTYPQYLVMQSLWFESETSLTQLSKVTRLDMGTLTPIVQRLELKSLLKRCVDVNDERKKVISLTEEGLSMKQDALLLKQKLLDKMKMSADDIEQLRTLCLGMLLDLS
ncbi:MarR family winged helix-turn-helix transcriptional regulator [Shewanella surugensis]|uniref:MarR family transcriptional regulator n=1 Tax=Shewanella surugensis TaxID=212020 RepID=A0ABT0LIU7_9GAMM|nr:MarR family transcriptional regulator [Shewanella surugensis]MCL1127642.1 MarR family transcriptional regulator [Shewanella surugensis]